MSCDAIARHENTRKSAATRVARQVLRDRGSPHACDYEPQTCAGRSPPEFADVVSQSKSTQSTDVSSRLSILQACYRARKPHSPEKLKKNEKSTNFPHSGLAPENKKKKPKKYKQKKRPKNDHVCIFFSYFGANPECFLSFLFFFWILGFLVSVAGPQDRRSRLKKSGRVPFVEGSLLSCWPRSLGYSLLPYFPKLSGPHRTVECYTISASPPRPLWGPLCDRERDWKGPISHPRTGRSSQPPRTA